MAKDRGISLVDITPVSYTHLELSGREFYQPSVNGYEVKIREHMARIKKEAAEASLSLRNIGDLLFRHR